MDGLKAAGRIVLENKNTLDWSNAFIIQARQYRTQYETPYVIIVSRRLPEKQRGMCVWKGVLVVEARLAPALVTALREGILEISRLRLTKVDSNQKATKLLAYIVGDVCQMRFRAMFTAITCLKELLDKEWEWHDRNWKVRRKHIAEGLEQPLREIIVDMQLIIKDDRKAPGRVITGDTKKLALAGD